MRIFIRYLLQIRGYLVLVILLTACGGQGALVEQYSQATRQAQPGASGANSRPTATPATIPTVLPSTIEVDENALKNVQIRFWHAWSGETARVIQLLVDDFNRTNTWGIAAEAVSYFDYDQLSEAMIAAFDSGEIPDLVAAYRYQVLDWTDGGSPLVDLQDYIQDPVWGWSISEQADLFTAFWGQPDEENRLSIPVLRSASLLYYNQTWARELGFTNPPATPEQFKAQACSAAQAYRNDNETGNDGTGGWIISTHYSTVLGWLHAFGTSAVATGTNGYEFGTTQTEQAFRYLREMYEAGCAWLPESEYTEGDFANRRGLFASGSVAGIPGQEAAFADLGSKDTWIVMPYPSEQSVAGIASYGPDLSVFAKTEENRLASWLLVKWLVEPAQQARLAQASAFLPVRVSSLEHVKQLPATYPQWAAASKLVAYAQMEPPYASWRIVRWALSDAATQLFRYYFTLDQLPQLIKLLDAESNDLHAQFR